MRCIPENLAENKPTLARFRDEARLGRLLDHPGIVRLIDSGDSEGLPYMAFEQVVGLPLAELIDAEAKRGGRFPVPLVLRIVADLLSAVQAAHEAQDEAGQPLRLVHRDLGAGSVLISRDGLVKLTGFAASDHGARSQQTSFGVVRGKLAYAAPESASASIDARSDLFSCGVLLYELLTLSRPFDRQSEFHTLKAIREEEPPAAASVRPDLPAELDGIVAQALAKNPGDRYESAAAMRAALERVGKKAKLATQTDLSGVASALLPARLHTGASGGTSDFAAILDWVGGEPIGAADDELPDAAPVARATQPVEPLVTARTELPSETALQPIPDAVDDEPVRTNPSPEPIRAGPPTQESALASSPTPELPALPRAAPPEQEERHALRPTPKPPDPKPPLTAPEKSAPAVPALAAAPLPSPPLPPPVPALPPKRARIPARKPRRQRTFASRFKAPNERGLHPLAQVIIVGLFAWGGVLTVAARKQASMTELQPLLAVRAPRAEVPLDTDTQVTDDEPDTASPPTLGPTPIAHEQKLAPDAPRSAAKSRLGTLVLEANPPSRVSVDDKDRGSTPLSLRLGAGTHLVAVIAPNGLTKHFRIEVPAGKKVRKVVTFPFTPPQPPSIRQP